MSADTNDPQRGAQLGEMLLAAATWATSVEAQVLASGRQLTALELAQARRVGVRDPARVRVQVVEAIPIPDHPALASLAQGSGALSEHTSGLTLGQAILVRRGCELDLRLMAHELRHVMQYEVLGGIPWFMAIYIPQVMAHGYRDAPLEVDAQLAEAI